MRGLSLVAASGGHSSSQCTGLSLSQPLFLRSTGSRRAGSVVVAHGPSCSAACAIFPDQGSNLCPLHWQADSQPLRHQGSPEQPFLNCNYTDWLCQNYLKNFCHHLKYRFRASKRVLLNKTFQGPAYSDVQLGMKITKLNGLQFLLQVLHPNSLNKIVHFKHIFPVTSSNNTSLRIFLVLMNMRL